MIGESGLPRCGFSSAGWRCNQCLRISGRGGSTGFSNYELQCGGLFPLKSWLGISIVGWKF